MAKPPVQGLAKTRLARDIGNKAALGIYEQLLSYTYRVAADSSLDTIVYFSESASYVDDFILFDKATQQGDDLGKRIYTTFEAELQNADACLMIGADCPDLSIDHLHAAAKALETSDLVLGPSDDGGYYLIGVKKAEEKLFANVAWSTSGVLEATMSNATTLGYSTHQLEELYDIDDLQDLRRSVFGHTADEAGEIRNLANPNEF